MVYYHPKTLSQSDGIKSTLTYGVQKQSRMLMVLLLMKYMCNDNQWLIWLQAGSNAHSYMVHLPHIGVKKY
jgi:hypothetical protein